MRYGTKQFSDAIQNLRQFAEDSSYKVIAHWKENGEFQHKYQSADSLSDAKKILSEFKSLVKSKGKGTGSVGIRDSGRGAYLINLKEGKEEVVQDNLH